VIPFKQVNADANALYLQHLYQDKLRTPTENSTIKDDGKQVGELTQKKVAE